MPNLLPAEFNKEVIPLNAANKQRIGYKRGLKFNGENGDVVRDGQNRVCIASGIEEWKRWCENCVMTQRNAYRAYTSDFGIDIKRALKARSRIETETILRHEIADALIADDYKRTISVNNIEFEWLSPDSLKITVSVTGIDGADINFTVPIKTG